MTTETQKVTETQRVSNVVFSVTLMLLSLGPALARADDGSLGGLAREACLYRQEDYEARRTGDMDEVLNSYPELESEVGRLTDELAETYYDLGVAYTELRAYSKAIDAYEKSVALNPASGQAHAHLGLLYKQVRHDPDKASRHLHTYLRLNPHAADREELEALLALMQRDQPTRSSTGSSAATWGVP